MSSPCSDAQLLIEWINQTEGVFGSVQETQPTCVLIQESRIRRQSDKSLTRRARIDFNTDRIHLEEKMPGMVSSTALGLFSVDTLNLDMAGLEEAIAWVKAGTKSVQHPDGTTTIILDP